MFAFAITNLHRDILSLGKVSRKGTCEITQEKMEITINPLRATTTGSLLLGAEECFLFMPIIDWLVSLTNRFGE
jgi:hypothetical protein